MTQRLSLIACVAWGALLLCPPCRGDSEASSNLREEEPEQAAYMAMVKADAARDAGLWVIALETYEKALDRFQTLAREHPDHMPGSVAYRIEYCRGEIAAIRNRFATTSAMAHVESARKIEALRQRINALESQLAETEDHRVPLTPEPSPRLPPQE